MAMFLFLLIVTAFAGTRLATSNEANSAKDTRDKTRVELPSLWDESELDAAIQSTGFFRILSEVHLDDNRGSYLLEEWLDGPGQTFRMDVITQHGQNDTAPGGHKKSLLVRGATSERHLFEPFQCSPFESLNEALGPSLSSKFPEDAHPLAAAGLGAIWLFATRAGAPPATFKRAFTSAAAPSLVPRDGLTVTKRTRARVMRTFDMFEVPEQSGLPFKTRIYFLADEWRRPNGKVNPSALVAVHLLDPGTGVSRFRMSARVLEIEVAVRPLASVQKSLFELPLGFGCTRPAATSGSLDDSYRPPRHCLGAANLERAHVCNLDLVTYLPNEPADDLDKWSTHTSSLRLAAGQLLGRAYLSLEQRDLVAAQYSSGRPLLRRSKRIWDLGEASELQQLEGGEYSDRYREAAAPRPPLAMYFELSEHLRVCHAYGNGHLDELPTIEFTLNIGQSAATSGAPTKRQVGLSLVDEQSMRQLFQTREGFHLVRDNAAPWPKFREMHHEKRVERLELRDRTGQVAWAGPASLVRRWYTPATLTTTTTAGGVGGGGGVDENEDQNHGTLGAEDQTPAGARDVRLTIHLFESTLFARQLGRLQLTMTAGEPLDEADLHRELNIEPCLQRRPADNVLLHTPLGGRDNLAFRLVYPLDVPESQALALRAEYRHQIYAKFLSSLATGGAAERGQVGLGLPASLGVDEGPAGGWPAFHIMQLSDLQVDVESNLIAISGMLHRWPEEFNYIKWPASQFANTNSSVGSLVLFLSELKSTSELCAQACSHYNCPLFVYDQIGKRCLLYETSSARAPGTPTARLDANLTTSCTRTGQPLGALKRDTYCGVYERAADSPRRAATPRQLVDTMNDWLARASFADQPSGEPDKTPARRRPNAPSSPALELDLELELTGEYADDEQAPAVMGKRRVTLTPSTLHAGSDLRHQQAALVLSAASGEQSNWAGAENVDFELSEGDETRGAPPVTIEAEFEVVFTNRKFRADNFHRASSGDPASESFPLEEAHSLSSQWDCELLCREHDCRSYSYCSLSQGCIVSKLHTQAAIEPAIEEGSFCVVLAREYLSKFDKLEALVSADLLAAQPNRASLKRGERRHLALNSARDCAISCMEARDFTCRSFVMCPNNQNQSGCHLFAERAALDNTALMGVRAPSGGDIENAATTAPSRCDLYQRSFLVDYQQFYGKRVSANAALGESVQLLRGLAAEDCASACSRASSGEADEQRRTCDAFHVCLSSPGPGKRHQLLCGLLTRKQPGAVVDATKLLLVDPSCSAFVPHGGPPASSPGGSPVAGRKRLAQNNDLETISARGPRSPGLAVSLLVILTGLATGYALTWLVALQNLNICPAVLVHSMQPDGFRTTG